MHARGQDGFEALLSVSDAGGLTLLVRSASGTRPASSQSVSCQSNPVSLLDLDDAPRPSLASLHRRPLKTTASVEALNSDIAAKTRIPARHAPQQNKRDADVARPVRIRHAAYAVLRHHLCTRQAPSTMSTCDSRRLLVSISPLVRAIAYQASEGLL